MARAPFQVLVLPYRTLPDGQIAYAIFKRADADYWQGIAGGGEDNESPLEAARREAVEEAGIDGDSEFVRLNSVATIPVVGVCGFKWGPDVLVIPEYCYGVKVEHEDLAISTEHTNFKWADYETASRELHWHSNKNALWELNHRLTR
jgi:dihydroneopterin triphosphate diphosphatase